MNINPLRAPEMIWSFFKFFRMVPNLNKTGCRYETETRNVAAFQKHVPETAKKLNEVTAAELLKLSHAVLNDCEAERDRMNQRVDRLLVVIGVFAGITLARFSPPFEPCAIGTLICFTISVAACLICRQPFEVISAAEPLGFLETIRKCDVAQVNDQVPSVLLALQIQRAIASSRQVNSWIASVVLIASLFLFVGVLLLFIAIAH